jgi:SPP1 gp7 family putative phage head morphogenesis protein
MNMGIVSNLTHKIFDFLGRKQDTLQEPDHNGSPAVSYAESPPYWIYDQFKVATDRLVVIREVKSLIKEDLRFRITNKRLADDATRGGFKVVVVGSEADRVRKKRQGTTLKRLTPGSNIAQSIVDDFMKRTKLATKVNEYARVLPRDGDLFLNPIVDMNAGIIVDVRRAPTSTIKRNSDEYGEFPDIQRAFSQIDPRTQYNAWLEIGPPSSSRQDFALFQMNHMRWLEEETEMYGTSHYTSARLFHLILSRMEKAAAVRREYRSVPKYAHEFSEGTPEAQIKQYARDMGLVDSKGNATKNAHLLSSFFGTAKVKILDENISLDQMGDIKYFEDLLWLNLGVPKSILTSGQDMNRDILKVQYPHYLKTLDDITDILEHGDSGQFSGIRAIIDLQLLLKGINPDSVSYDVLWQNRTDETPSERLDRVQIALGSSGGEKLITREKAIQVIANDFDIEDADEMARLVEEEKQRDQAAGLETQKGSTINLLTNRKKQENDFPLTDSVSEDRQKMDEIEVKAKGIILRFFRAIYKQMMDYEESINDFLITDSMEDEITESLDEAWDAEEGSYQIGIVKSMTEAGFMGAERAVQLVMDFDKGKATNPKTPEETSTAIKPRIVKTDIRDDLLEASGERIQGIKATTLKRIRETLADGFEENLGWKGLMKQLQPIIVDDVRAEMIARTELSWAYNQSAKRIYRDAGFSKVEWSTVIDQRTCPHCKERNGNEYGIDSHPDIPAHPRCRCTLLPMD